MNNARSLLQSLRRTRGIAPVRLPEPIPLAELPTPALIVDEVLLETNLRHMQSYLESKGKKPRPHAKMHKCPMVAKKQLNLGAVGICVAKVAEAEVMREADIGPLLITSPIASLDAIERVVALAIDEAQGLMLVVDDQQVAKRLSDRLVKAGVRLDVLIDIDPDMGRTGVRGADAVLRLAEQIGTLPGLVLCGLQQYAGHVMHIKEFEQRRAKSLQHWQSAVEIRRRIAANLAPMAVLTGGGTGTFDIDVDVAEITDLQVGSYAFMDEEYLQLAGPTSARFTTFAPALQVLATVISKPREGFATVDAGIKSMAAETVAPSLPDLPEVRFRFAGDEHGVLQLGGSNQRLAVGDRVRLIPSHCDPTVNLYDWIFPVRDGMVAELWPIAARGCNW